jgi:hypothetical protein
MTAPTLAELTTSRRHWPWFRELERDIRDWMRLDPTLTLAHAYALSLAVRH